MSLIVACSQERETWVGSDSFVGNSCDSATTAVSKIWLVGRYVTGACGDIRASQILRTITKWPKELEPIVISYMIKEAFERHEYLQRIDGSVKREDFSALIVGDGRMVEITESLAVIEVLRPYIAIGAGAYYALGSLFTTQGKAMVPSQERVLSALKAGAEHSPFVREPFNMLTPKRKRGK